MTRSVQSKMARGALWMMLFKFAERSLGLVSTLILVRLLVPADFGIVAMAMSFVIAAELLTAFGFDIALIQRQDLTDEHYHSAWTCNVLLGLAVTLVMFAAAQPVALFYGRPEVFWVVCTLAVGPLIAGAENIGVVAFRKELDFRKEFRFQLTRKVISFAVAVPLAFWLQNYWALVAGVLASRLTGTLNSYQMHPFRPRLSLREARALINFSKWLLFNNIVVFLKERTSDFFIGRLHGPAALGLYNVSYEFAMLPSTELSAPINRALLPGFAKMTADPIGLAKAYGNAVGMLALFATPAAVGLYAIAPYFVPVVLGPNWLAATSLLELLAFNGMLMFFHSSISAVLIGAGHPKRVMTAHSVYVLILIVGLFLLSGIGAKGAAYAALTASILATPVYLFHVKRSIGVGSILFLHAVWRPVIGSLLMAAVVRAVLPEYVVGRGGFDAVGLLVFGVVTGVLTYASVMLIGWLLLGRPPGAERVLYEKIRGRLRARLAAEGPRN